MHRSKQGIVEHVARALEESANAAAGRPAKFPKLPAVLHPVVRGLLFKRAEEGGLSEGGDQQGDGSGEWTRDTGGGTRGLETAHKAFNRISVGSPMAYDDKLANRIRQVLAARGDVAERKIFGGLAFLLQGCMCCGIVGNDLMVRVSADEFDAVIRGRHVRPMDFTGKPLRGFVYVSPPGFRTAAALRTWLSRGERVAEEKAAQPARPSGRRKTRSAGAPDQTSRARRSH